MKTGRINQKAPIKLSISLTGEATRGEIVKALRDLILVLRKSPTDEVSLGWEDYGGISINVSVTEK